MSRKFHYMFANRTLTYVSTEGEPAIKAYEMELANAQKLKKGKGKAVNEDAAGNKEEFEAMKKKMKTTIIASVVSIIALVIGAFIYKNTR